MSLKKFELVLNSPVYYAGQTVVGFLIVELEESKRVKEIYITYNGRGTVQWTVHKTIYRGRERYFKIRERVFGNGMEDRELTSGKHVFSFSLQLPSNLPCSYKDGHGRIEYSIQATINRSWRINRVKKQLITVMPVFDLNQTIILPIPTIIKETKTFFGHSGPLSMTFVLPITGFVPGQIIPIEVTVHNQSGVRVRSIVAVLSRKSTYYVYQYSAGQAVGLSKKEVRLEDGFGLKKVFIDFEVPALPPSNINRFSKIMDFKYFLTVIATVGKFHRNLSIPRQIEIGNIPYMPYQKPITRRQPFDPELDRSENHFPQLMQYGDFASPTFEKLEVPSTCMKRKPDLLYPVYEFAAQQST